MSRPGVLRWGEAARWLFSLHSLTAEQLAMVMRPACSAENARRALVGLEHKGMARRYPTIPPWRQPPGGRPMSVYALTRKGVEAGGFLCGKEEASAKKLRAMYSRGFSEWRVAHNMLRNSWTCRAIQETELDLEGIRVEEAVGEHGAVLRDDRPASITIEADGLLRFSRTEDPRWSLRAFVESDTGSQGKAEIIRKVGRYLACFDSLARPDPETGIWPPLPVALIFSPHASRSEKVAEWVAEAIAEQEWRTRSLRDAGVEPDDFFLISCLPWTERNGALGRSCFSALSRELRSVLSAPYARPGKSGSAG